MTLHITMDNVLDLLKQAVDTRGRDYKYHDEYQACRYSVDNGATPACLIGVLIHQHGTATTLANATANYSDVTELFGFGASHINDVLSSSHNSLDPSEYVHRLAMTNSDDRALGIRGFKVDHDAVIVLKAAQSVQDDQHRSNSWGDAYDVAEQVHALLSEAHDEPATG